MTRLYALALRLLPAEVREAHGAEMATVFEQLLADRRRRGGLRAVARAAVREFGALLHFAWCVRRGAPRPRRIDERLLAWPAHDERSPHMRGLLLQDVRYAVRLLARSPGTTLACVVTMAVAIGANTAVFSLVNGVLLAPLPFPAPERLVVLGHFTDGGTAISTTTPGNLYDWQARTDAFERFAGFAYTQRIVERGEYAERVLGALSVGSVFEVLGRQAARGRTLSVADDDPGAAAVVVLADRFARRVFGDSDSVGQTLRIGGVPTTVVGVMAADFAFPDFDAEYWVPARFEPQFRGNRDQYFLLGLGLLRGNVTLEQSITQLDAVMDGIRQQFPQATQNATAAVVPLKTFVIDGVGTRIWLLMGGVVLVLMIACANIANLLLSRGAARRQEMAVRHALGARGARLIRQMLTESIVLALAGGCAGLLAGAAMLRALLAWMPDDLPRIVNVELDLPVLVVTAVTVIASGLAFGLWPAIQLSRGSVAEGVRTGARDTGRRDGIRATLVIAQVALSLTLLAGAGLLARSFSNLASVRPGFEPGRLLTFNVSLPGAVYPDPAARAQFFERAVAGLRTLPGVASVALSTTLPVAGRGVGAWFNILDRPLPADQTPPAVPYRVITPGYFATVGVPLRRGRAFTADDGGEGRRTVVISEAVERRFWPGESALGKHIYLGAPDNRLFPDAEIVGIVGDVKQSGLDEESSEAVYIPHRMMPAMTTFAFAMRTATEPTALATSARAVLREIDPAVPVHAMQSMDDIVARALAPARSSVYLISLFAVLALLLATIGVFGVLSYTVAQRRPELAIRLALGAPANAVLLLVLRQGLLQIGAGVAIGLVLCAGLTRYIESLLFGVQPTDPLTLVGVTALLMAVGLIAVGVPARRATRVDSARVLREG